MGRRQRQRIRSFTLIELFLSIGMIALIGGLVLVKTAPLLNHHRFNRGVSKLKEEIGLSRRLSKVANADIELHITQTSKGLRCIRKTDEPLKLVRTFDLPITISHLRMEEESVSLIFTATGWVKDESEIHLSYKDKSETIHVKKS